MYTALKCIFGNSTYCNITVQCLFMHLCIYHSAIKCTRCNIAQWKECNIVHRVQYSTGLRVQDSAVMGQLGAWVLSHFCGAVQPKPHQWWLFSVQCAVLNISSEKWGWSLTWGGLWAFCCWIPPPYWHFPPREGPIVTIFTLFVGFSSHQDAA